MKASLNWLRSLVPGLEHPAQEIAGRFTCSGLEVETLSTFGGGLDRVVVGAVLDVQPHPSRDGLQVVAVDRGDGTVRKLVCGAPNLPAPGGLVCLAEIGARLASGVAVSSREFGGVLSDGMLCSEAELGIGDDAGGILVLSETEAKPGTPLSVAAPFLCDTVFEIAVTPNRPDALGHVGLAREIAALLGLPFSAPRPEAPLRVGGGSIDQHVAVHVEDFERCPHYGALMVDDVCIGPSPLWLRSRLASLGVRSISNIVDITNLVLLEYGHPMHAFDLERIRGARIIVRRATAGERMKTLDGVERVLDQDDLLICDAEGPVALGGVMGGENTEIRADTRRVLFECATFNPRGIRRTSRRHGLRSESSYRFERGIDPGDVVDVLAHAGSLATRLAGAAAVPGSIHARRDPLPIVRVSLRSSRLNRLLGDDVPIVDARANLQRLGFGVTELHDGAESTLLVEVPSHRPDVAREADLIEEVARVRGLDCIPTTIPPICPQAPRSTLLLEGRARRAAVELGLSEAMTYGFVSPQDLERVGAPAPSVRLLNPITEERTVMRTSLVPGLLEVVARARRRGERNARLFAIGSVFLEARDQGLLPDERCGIAVVLAGSRDAYLERAGSFDVYDAKGIATEITERVARRSDYRVGSLPIDRRPRMLHPRAAGEIVIGDRAVGRFGLIHPDVVDDLDMAGAVAVVEIDLAALGSFCGSTPNYRPIPKLPASTRDIALVVGEDVPVCEIERVIREAAGPLCESLEIFDVFRGTGIPQGCRSVAFHVVYRDPKASVAPEDARTLTDEEVDHRHAHVVNVARERLGAQLR